MKIFICGLIVLLTGGNLFALSGKEYLQKINANYTGLNSFELTLDYKLYKGAFGTQIRDNYTSELRINGQKSHRRIYHDEIITNENLSVIINHELKTIQILPPVKHELIDPEIENSLKYCETVTMSAQGQNNFIEITFQEFSSVPYSRIELLVDKNFWIINVKLFYSTQLNFSKSYLKPENGYPRLEINYKNLKKNWNDETGLTDISKFLILDREQYKTTSAFSSYKILSQ